MTQPLTGFEVLLGVSGGIAAYKAAMLCSQLTQAGAWVTVVMTENARRFVGELTFSTLSGRNVYHSLWESPKVYDSKHIALTEQADLFVVAPATANLVAKAATGLCDDLLSTLLASADSPVLLAPAMNQRMWHHPITQRNIKTLLDVGYHMIGPESGRLACGAEGIGRMSEPEAIYHKIGELLKPLKPKKPR